MGSLFEAKHVRMMRDIVPLDSLDGGGNSDWGAVWATIICGLRFEQDRV